MCLLDLNVLIGFKMRIINTDVVKIYADRVAIILMPAFMDLAHSLLAAWTLL